MDSKQKKALEQAIASVEMEGFRFTDKDRKLCEKLVSGEISFSDFLKDCKAGKFKAYVGG
ncbi:MAG: antitoxin VbhA family protein [Ruminococcus sp.]|nr:antitoxin VbhA family protein [Ruminococcus sp.]